MTTGDNKSRATLLILGVFVLGLVCGAALLYAGQRSVRPLRRPPPSAGVPPMEQLVQELNLDPGQKTQVQAIVDRNRVQLEGLLHNSRQDIRDLLRPDQQEKFDRMPGRGPRGIRNPQ